MEKMCVGVWSLLCLLVCLAGGGAAVDVCPESGRRHRIAPGDTTYGEISGPAGQSCAAESLAVVSPPPPPSLLLPAGGWRYLFGAVVDGPLPAAVEFTVSVRCGGAEVCRATVIYDVEADADIAESIPDGHTTTTTTSTTQAPSLPPCAASVKEYKLVMSPGKANIATLPTSAVQVDCPSGLQASITQPEIGSAALLGPGSMQFVYASTSDDLEENITLPYEIKCDEKLICSAVMRIWLHVTVPKCPNNQLVYNVKPGGQLNGTLTAGAVCDGVLSARLLTEDIASIFKFNDGVSFTFNAPDKEEDLIVGVRLYCDDESLCDVVFALVITSESRPNPTPPPDTSSTDSPTTTPMAMCKEQFKFFVPTGEELKSSLHTDVEGCNLITYRQPLYNSSENFEINIIGDFLYEAPLNETVEEVPVDVFCMTELKCRTYLTFTSFKKLTPTEPPTNPPVTGSPIPECANVYYYQTAPGVALSDSLNGMPGQDACAYGRYFSIIDFPQDGKLDITPIGDFLYRPERHEGAYDFSFSMFCLNKLYCQGKAYILVSNEWTLPPTGGSTSPSTPPTQHEITNKQIKCQGTCNENAWKTYPKPAMWDNTPGAGYARRDGNPVDGIRVSWENNSVVINVFTIIGNLGVRFPTFEPLDRMVGKYFEPEDFDGAVEPSSPGFELSCLANQGSTGLGEDVWHWKTLGNGSGTGSVGALYNKGNSWYQKFGGKHIGCDTFVDSCRYAPLLTPAVANTTSSWRWEINIDDCDATWTGTFPYASLEKLRKSDGSPVWYFVGDKQIKGTIISEGVRANSWIEPAQSFDVEYETHDVIFDLHQIIVVNKLAKAMPFSIDSEFFEYIENGDRAFGVNLLFHPYVTEEMETSYAEDRHVVGFKWITQDWIAPSREQCITCKGNKTHCSAEGRYATSTYTGEFPSGDCPQGTGRVELRKGPSMNTSMCAFNKMHVYNRSGFSPTTNCEVCYQNLTIRGVVLGSGDLPSKLKRAFSYEGRVLLQLLMTDGSKHDVAIDISMYVTRLSQGSYAAEGHLSVCRGSDYWPVLDPLGTSLPDKPFELSTATRAPLCIGLSSSTFGPSGWATVFLQLPGILSSQVNVHSIVLRYMNTTVFLLYQDPKTHAAVIPPSSVGYWWKYTHPFLSFRPLINGLTNNITLTIGPEVNPSEVADVPFAFAFIPGAINVATNVEITLEATITTDTVSTSTFSRIIHVDPMMTQRSRHGPPKKKNVETVDRKKRNALGVGAIAGVAIGITIVGIVFLTMDNNKPLPKWAPRGKHIKNTVLAAIPIGLRPAKKEKSVVHKDMYDAMRSGKY